MTKFTFPDLQELLVRSVELSPVPVSVSDITSDDQPLVYVNKAFERLTGYSREDILGKNCRFLQGDDTDMDTVQRIREGISQGIEVRETLLNYRKDESPFWNDLKLVPIHYQDREDSPAVAYIGIQQDISRLRVEEIALRQKQKLQSIGQLSGSISHEVNNMLHPILSLGRRLKKEANLDERHLEMLDIMIESAQRSEDILQKVLAFSREQEQELEVLPIESAFNHALETITATIPPMIKLNLTSKLDGQERCLLSQTQMAQVMTNLVANAIYANDGKGTIDIEANNIDIDLSSTWHRLVPAGKYAIFSVTDRGAGVSKNTIDLIFDPFFTTKPVGKGTGLGLSVCWGILRDWRGAIRAENITGKGACFEFVIPLLPNTGEVQ